MIYGPNMKNRIKGNDGTESLKTRNAVFSAFRFYLYPIKRKVQFENGKITYIFFNEV